MVREEPGNRLWEFFPSKAGTHVASEIQGRKDGLAARAELLARDRKLGATIECLLLGLQQIEAQLPVVIHGRPAACRQSFEQGTANRQPAPVDAGSDRPLLQPQHAGDFLRRQLGDLGQHERQAIRRGNMLERDRDDTFGFPPPVRCQRIISGAGKRQNRIRCMGKKF